jgi:hypothetical protein
VSVAVLAGAMAGGSAVAMADTPAAPLPAPSAVAPGGTAAPAAAEVSGFRSATFGMDEADVKAAILKDFGIKATAIASGENAAERTRVLSVSVPELLQDGGAAQVSYVFGYKSKGLIQVGISWSHQTDPTITADKLVADGDVLRAHFLGSGYAPDSIKTGLALPNGLLLFRGEDADGHATVLILEGSFRKAVDGKQDILTPAGLALLYSANPAHPDIFKIAPGRF